MDSLYKLHSRYFAAAISAMALCVACQPEADSEKQMLQFSEISESEFISDFAHKTWSLQSYSAVGENLILGYEYTIEDSWDILRDLSYDFTPDNEGHMSKYLFRSIMPTDNEDLKNNLFETSPYSYNQEANSLTFMPKDTEVTWKLANIDSSRMILYDSKNARVYNYRTLDEGIAKYKKAMCVNEFLSSSSKEHIKITPGGCIIPDGGNFVRDTITTEIPTFIECISVLDYNGFITGTYEFSKDSNIAFNVFGLHISRLNNSEYQLYLEHDSNAQFYYILFSPSEESPYLSTILPIG